MKTLLFLLALAATLTRPARAQNPQLVIDQAATLPSLATPGSGIIYDLSEYTDAQGNTYQAGTFSGTVHFGSFTFATGTGEMEVVVAKRNATGTYQWALAGGGAGDQRCKALTVDAAGNVYVTGSFPTATATFGATVLTNRAAAGTTTSDVFAAKVTAAGAWDWAVSAGGGTRINGDDYGTAVGVDLFGNAYVAGTFTSSVAFFGSIQVPSPDRNGRDIAFVAKLSSGGIWQWVRNNEDFGSSATAVATDEAGNTYLSGHFRGRIHYGPFLVTASNGAQTAYIAKVDATGAWQWATAIQAGVLTNGHCQQFGVVLDRYGNAYSTGVFTSDTLKFDRTTLTNTGPRQPPAYTSRTYNAFVAKLNVATGRWRWAAQSRGDGDEGLGGPLFDAQGQLYVGGGFSPPPGASGPGPGSQFGSTTLFSAGGDDIVVAQLDTAGRWLWARRAGGPDNEGGAPRRLDAQGRVYVAGSFYGSTLPLGALTLTALPGSWGNASSTYSLFEARLGVNGPLAVRNGRDDTFDVYPNPAHTAVTVAGLPPGQVVQVLDIVGRKVLAGTVPPQGTLQLALPAGLPPGVYLVRAGAQTRRLVVE
ncbi:T9SS type A sorting domain-containing protein [Hymenobacter properus]|uniref:T9SS type A sorting domain-containing protein n=1 Tax=Hymenobacter properus TaxID=2791026 RepID=A0A931BIV8_9BACT|nr:T9SS type A sorting domain-containing protein [Hymenobacter properus]MBF9143102.1 T9SS type A sorting domain-containing protein [Hymenobacter properus]MBR7721910.1 T9SS type A sorting domain-containing protein [Microvirga sp. SRT04]